MDLNQKVDVQIEALPVVSAVLDNTKKSHVEVVGIIEHDGKQAVNARELHQKLGNKRQFANWIKQRIEQYGFVENQDYEFFNKFVKNSNGGRSRIEYALSLDMAKELCMIENNERSTEIYKYITTLDKGNTLAKSNIDKLDKEHMTFLDQGVSESNFGLWSYKQEQPNKVRVFESPMFGKIRVAGTSEKPLFCLVDVARGLEYANPAKAVIDHCKGVTIIETPTNGGKQKLKFGSEGQMYRLVLKAKTEKAEAFQDWVTDKVLPTIRKTGSYGIPQTYSEALLLAANQAKKIEEQQLALEQQKEELVKASQEIVELSATITKSKPKATYFDIMMKNKSTSVITSTAQDYGMSAKAFNKLLFDLGIQHKVAGQWVLYRQYLDKGYVNSEPVSITHSDGTQTVKYISKWTQRGRYFLYEFLKSKDILPLIERKN